MNIISIIGRPNVGKSTLFNRLIEHKKSVTHETPGTTRDRIYGLCKWGKHKFTLVDTGGLDITSKKFLNKQIVLQIESALKESSLFIFLLDGQTLLSNLDYQIADILRCQNKKVIVAINKMDDLSSNLSLGYKLGFEKCIEISSLQGLNINVLLDEIINSLEQSSLQQSSLEQSSLQQSSLQEQENIFLERKKIAIMGKPNVGKSSLINAWLGEKRVIIDPCPGTTIDSIDINFDYNKNHYTLFDTAGIRRKTKINEDLEIYSVIRSIKIIQQVDIVLLLIDATQGISDQDKKILYQIEKHNKACIILLNKWDLIKSDKDKYFNKLKENFMVKYYPFLSISALTKQRIFEVFNLIEKIWQNYTQEISTSKLNKAIGNFISKKPFVYQGKELKIHYITQKNAKPPTFIFFINTAKIPETYLRYIENNLRKNFDFEGVPIRFLIRQNNKK